MTRRWMVAAGAAVMLAAAAGAVGVRVGHDGGGMRPSRALPPAAPSAAPSPAPSPTPERPEPPATAPPTVAAPPPVRAAAPATAPPAPGPPSRPGPACTGSGAPAAAPFPGDDPRGGRRWVTVGHVAGRCGGASPVFHLRGIDTRLVFRSDAGSLVVFLVDARQGVDATAGYADAECDRPCSDSQVLVDQAGDYLLQVQADGGPWEAAVQEYRAP